MEDRLRRLCGRITPEKRLAVILTFFIIFSLLSIYMTVSSIYNLGKGDGESVRIEHIDQPELKTKSTENGIDRTNKEIDSDKQRSEKDGVATGKTE